MYIDVHWNENTEDRKNSSFPPNKLGKFAVILVTNLC